MAPRIKDLKAHYQNPRTITEKQYSRITKSLDKFGDLSGIVFNRKNNMLVSGHMRTKHFESLKGNISISESFDKPDDQGTVCMGFIGVGSKKYSYREVEFSEKEHEKAMLLANRAGGDWNTEMLANNWDAGWLKDEIGFEDWEVGGFDSEKGESEEKSDKNHKLSKCPSCGHEF